MAVQQPLVAMHLNACTPISCSRRKRYLYEEQIIQSVVGKHVTINTRDCDAISAESQVAIAVIQCYWQDESIPSKYQPQLEGRRTPWFSFEYEYNTQSYCDADPTTSRLKWCICV